MARVSASSIRKALSVSAWRRALFPRDVVDFVDCPWCEKRITLIDRNRERCQSCQGLVFDATETLVDRLVKIFVDGLRDLGRRR